MTVYGDLNHVKRMLRPDPDTTLDEDVDERLALIQVAVSAAMEERMGRSFGATAEDTTYTVYAGASPVLLLPVPARTITSITIDDVVVDDTLYVLDPVDYRTQLAWGVRAVSGANWGWNDAANRPLTPVVIVGDFTDSDVDADIPADIQYAANRLIAATFQTEGASPFGGIGPDGEVFRPPDPWKDPLVAEIIKRYRSQARHVVAM